MREELKFLVAFVEFRYHRPTLAWKLLFKFWPPVLLGGVADWVDDGRGGLADPWLPRHLLPVQAQETALRETKNKKTSWASCPKGTVAWGEWFFSIQSCRGWWPSILFLDDRLHHLVFFTRVRQERSNCRWIYRDYFPLLSPLPPPPPPPIDIYANPQILYQIKEFKFLFVSSLPVGFGPRSRPCTARTRLFGSLTLNWIN
jgi:hypothetical protein